MTLAHQEQIKQNIILEDELKRKRMMMMMMEIDEDIYNKETDGHQSSNNMTNMTWMMTGKNMDDAYGYSEINYVKEVPDVNPLQDPDWSLYYFGEDCVRGDNKNIGGCPASMIGKANYGPTIKQFACRGSVRNPVPFSEIVRDNRINTTKKSMDKAAGYF